LIIARFPRRKAILEVPLEEITVDLRAATPSLRGGRFASSTAGINVAPDRGTLAEAPPDR
jgi:hypothetical protein